MARLWLLAGIQEDGGGPSRDMKIWEPPLQVHSDDVEFKGGAFLYKVIFALSLPSLSCQW